MDDDRLALARQLIEILAKHDCTPVGSGGAESRQPAARRVREAARMSYALPGFCAEMNREVAACIACIIDGAPPEICRRKRDEPAAGENEPDIGWGPA